MGRIKLSTRGKKAMSELLPVIHLHDDEVEPHVIWSPNSLVIKFHQSCDLEALSEFLGGILTKSQHKRFVDVWSNDHYDRAFQQHEGFIAIS
jgi:hypothetical protein